MNLAKSFLRYHKTSINFFLLSLLIVTIPSFVFAHKVNIFAYVEDGTVYTESYFPDGKKVSGGLVEVYDSQGNKLLEGKTNKDGYFNFKPSKRDDLKIFINASMGHKSSYTLSVDELPKKITTQNLQKIERRKSKNKETFQVDLGQIKNIIDDSIDEKLKPIKIEIRKLKQRKITFVEVIAGIGYIFGIMGIALYFLNKRKKP